MIIEKAVKNCMVAARENIYSIKTELRGLETMQKTRLGLVQ
jgi:hypothetical protein